MTQKVGEYEIDAVFPVETNSSVEPGTNLLLVGPAETDARTLAVRLLAQGYRNDEESLVITTNGDVDEIVERFRGVTETDDLSSLSIIDCSGESEPEPEGVAPEQFWEVQSPGSLTELGISFVEYGDQGGATFAGNRVLFDSLTTLLEHVSEERAFEFIDAFMGRFAASGYFGTWLVDPSALDEQTRTAFEELFDVVVELRRDDGEREFRISGYPDVRSQWRPVPES